MGNSTPYRICFVCLGNICRSPLAQGVFERLLDDKGLADKFTIASAGTGNWHEGDPPDRRMFATAKRAGIQLNNRAKQFLPADFKRFDLVLAMDRDNLKQLERLQTLSSEKGQLQLFRSFDSAANGNLDVPDPYYGGDGGFDNVFNIVHRTCPEILKFAKSKLSLSS